MFSLAALFSSGVCIALGVGRVLSVKKNDEARREALDAAQLIKTEIRFRRTPFCELCELLEERGYSYIALSGGVPYLSDIAGKEAVGAFSLLISKIGTTDLLGQLELCDEICLKLSEILKKESGESASKIKVCGALTALFALCILII